MEEKIIEIEFKKIKIDKSSSESNKNDIISEKKSVIKYVNRETYIKEYNIPMVILNKWDDLFNLNLNYTNYDFNNIKIYVSDFIKMIK
jgi:hypothetical protein